MTKFGDKTKDDYYALTVNGRTNPIDYLKTEIVFKQYPGGRFPYFKGLYFEPGSWDGSDIFMSQADINGRSTAFIYATKKFVDTIRKSRIKNIKFINFNDFEIDCGTIKVGATESMIIEIENKIKKSCV